MRNLDVDPYAGTAGAISDTSVVGAPPCASDDVFLLGARR